MVSKLSQRGVLALKGMAMGAADVVPGVSGGTIAFITGIYEELLSSLKSLNPAAVRKLFREGPAAFWQHINGWFLLPLFAGIGLAIALLARPILYLLKNHPELIWSFFFGLIVASILLVGRTVKKWGVGPVVSLLVGIAVAYWITEIQSPAGENANLGYILLCGMVAICAMILPGISGSFILLLMGVYELVVGTVKGFVDCVVHFEFGELGPHLKIAGTFAIGAVVGLISFSHALTWLFRRFHDFTVALLVGFLVGSLNAVWPWKETLSTRIRHAGKPDEEVVPFIRDNVWPGDYATPNQIEMSQLGLTAKDPQLVFAILLAIFGFALILILERFGPESGEPESDGG